MCTINSTSYLNLDQLTDLCEFYSRNINNTMLDFRDDALRGTNGARFCRVLVRADNFSLLGDCK